MFIIHRGAVEKRMGRSVCGIFYGIIPAKEH
jgi:hypothetical protein